MTPDDDDVDQLVEQVGAHDADTPIESLPIRLAGAVMAPFVLAGEVVGNGVVAFFNAAEKLNPVPLLLRILRPIGDWSMRFMRALRSPLRPIEELLDRVVLWSRRTLQPITVRLRELGRYISARLAGVRATANRIARRLQRALRRLFETPRRLWREATAPARRLAARLRIATREILTRK